MSLTALFSGIMNSFDKFAAAASSQMVGNIFIVTFVMALAPLINDTGTLLAFSITGCGLIQLFWVLVPCHAMGMRLVVRRPKLTENVKKLFRLMAPVALGSGVHQFNILIGTAIASTLPIGGVSYLYYAERFTQLPLSVIGTAMSTVLLPLLSRQIRAGKLSEAKESQNYGIELTLLFTVPATIGLIILAYPFVKIMFEHGAFDSKATLATSYTLIAFAIGLPAYVLTKVFNTTFYAQKDTATPLKAALLSVVVDIVISLLLFKYMQHAGIALATSIAAWANVSYLGFVLRRQEFLNIDKKMRGFFIRLLTASLLMTPLVIGSKNITVHMLNGSSGEKVLALMIMIISGFCAFLILAQITGALNFNKLRLQFRNSKEQEV